MIGAADWYQLGEGLAVGVGAGATAGWLVTRRVARRMIGRVRSAERRARASERLAEVGAMSGGLAHEIKNPLSTIGLNAQLLGEGVRDSGLSPDEKARFGRRIDSLRREVERLRGILSDFLQYAGELRLEPRSVDVNVLVSELVDFFLPQAEKHGVRLRADLHASPLVASIDPAHVKQALLNLMLNAVQAMCPGDGGGGGAPPVSPGAPERPKELILKTIPIRGEEAGVQVHVIDTGPGITPEARERLFTPYFTTKPGGTGLGLPTARRLVEAHAGRIEVFSEMGKGTDFVMTFPT